jgi:sulfonate transport system substrate-binding protein
LPSDAAAALERGDIAAYAAPIQTAPVMVAKGARVLDRASDHAGLVGSSVTVLTKQFAEASPDFATAWNDLRAESVADLKKNLEAYYAFHAETVHVPVEIAKISYPQSLFVGEPLSAAGLELLEGTKRFLVQQKLAQSDFSVSEWALSESLPRR